MFTSLCHVHWRRGETEKGQFELPACVGVIFGNPPKPELVHVMYFIIYMEVRPSHYAPLLLC